MAKCTSKQLEVISTLFSELGWDYVVQEYWIKGYFLVDRVEDLTANIAAMLIKSLRNKQAEQQRNRECESQMITEKQIPYLKTLWLDVDYSAGDCGNKHLSAFLEKRFKVKKVEDLTCKQAIACIIMIKKLLSQGQKREGKTTVLSKKSHCRYCGRLIMWVELADGRRMPFDFDNNNKATDFHECKDKRHAAGC